MHILCESKYFQHLEKCLNLNEEDSEENSEENSLDQEINSKKCYDVIIATFEGYKYFLDLNIKLNSITNRILILPSFKKTNSNDILKVRPTFFVESSDDLAVNSIFIKLKSEYSFLNKKREARLNTESKRKELEKLNGFLQIQEKERASALKIFQEEEYQRKINERKLLYFLDMINSEYNESHFLDELFKYLWSEIRKYEKLNQLGFYLNRTENPQDCYLFQYSNNFYSVKKINFEFNVTDKEISHLLANINMRPTGQIMSWTTQSSQAKFRLYVESTQSQQKQMDQFMIQSIDLISLIVTRWLAEQDEKKVLNKWQEIFQSYQDPIHVIDQNFNIIHSNYSEKSQNLKCYEFLAERNSTCENCPVINYNAEALNQDLQMNIKDENYSVSVAPFDLNGFTYFLNFYKNKTQENILKSEFIQSEKMLTIGHLANHLAHELNNPLTGLKMSNELLIQELSTQNNNNASILSDLSEISKAVNRSEFIIQDLMDFRSDKMNQMQSLDFSIAVKKTMTLLKSVIRNHSMFIDLKMTIIYAHPIYLQQVIFNLIKNAAEIMSNPGTIKIYQMSIDQKSVQICFEDSGPGLNEKVRNNIFKPFFTTKKEGEGTGLGLYLCFHLMKKMNSELIYDSSFKSGARFILKLNRYLNDHSN